MIITESDVRGALARVEDPELRQGIVDLGMVRDLRVTDGRVSFTLALTSAACPLRDRIETYAGDDFRPIAERLVQLAPDAPPVGYAGMRGGLRDLGQVLHT